MIECKPKIHEDRGVIMTHNSELVRYKSVDGEAIVDVQFDAQNNTVWLSKKSMALLFGKSRVTITDHIKNIFQEKELNPSSVCRNFRHTASDGKMYTVEHYDLNVIISVGFRVKSKRASQFRIWATQRLHSYIMQKASRSTASGYSYIDKRTFNITIGDVRIDGSKLGLFSTEIDKEALVLLLGELKEKSPDCFAEYLDSQVQVIKNGDQSRWKLFLSDLLNEESCFRRLLNTSTESKDLIKEIVSLFTF